MQIKETVPADLNDVLFVEREAFNSHVEADLTRNLLVDPTAKPILKIG